MRSRCPVLTQFFHSRDALVDAAIRHYQQTSRRSKRICGPKYQSPCVIRFGGEVACAELQRLGLSKPFDSGSPFWLEDEDLANLDSTLCIVANKLAAVSEHTVRCWWDNERDMFVLFANTRAPEPQGSGGSDSDEKEEEEEEGESNSGSADILNTLGDGIGD